MLLLLNDSLMWRMSLVLRYSIVAFQCRSVWNGVFAANVIGLMLLGLTFLSAAAMLQGMDKREFGVRPVLILIRACMTFLDTTIHGLVNLLQLEKKEHQEQNIAN